MKKLQVYLTDEQYIIIKEDADKIGLQISSYLRFLALSKQSTGILKKPIKMIKEVKPIKIKLTSLDKLMQEYINANPNDKVFIENHKVVVQERRYGNKTIILLPVDIEGDESKYSEGEKLIILETERDNLSEFDFMKGKGT